MQFRPRKRNKQTRNQMGKASSFNKTCSQNRILGLVDFPSLIFFSKINRGKSARILFKGVLPTRGISLFLRTISIKNLTVIPFLKQPLSYHQEKFRCHLQNQREEMLFQTKKGIKSGYRFAEKGIKSGYPWTLFRPLKKGLFQRLQIILDVQIFDPVL